MNHNYMSRCPVCFSNKHCHCEAGEVSLAILKREYAECQNVLKRRLIEIERECIEVKEQRDRLLAIIEASGLKELVLEK